MLDFFIYLMGYLVVMFMTFSLLSKLKGAASNIKLRTKHGVNTNG